MVLAWALAREPACCLLGLWARQRDLLMLLELLVGWEPAAMRRLARSGRMWVAHPFAVTDPSEALISQWEIAAARAALVDAHGTPAQLGDIWFSGRVEPSTPGAHRNGKTSSMGCSEGKV